MLTLLAKLPICWPNVWQIYVDAALLWNFWRCLWYHFCRLTYISRFVQLYRCELLCFFRVKSAKFSRMYLLCGDDSGTCNPYWYSINPLMPPTLKPQSSKQLYSNIEYSDWYTGRWWMGWYIWYSEEGPGPAAVPSSRFLDVPNVTAHPSTASVPTLYYSMWHYNCF